MHHHRVPTTKQVVPGALVNIVLKADQPTGRTVSGAIKDVLTKGEHHRGIKVRLVDGRIGRVQSMVRAPEGSQASSSSSGGALETPGDDVSPVVGVVDAQPGYGGRRPGGRQQPRFVQDVRTDPYTPPASDAVPVGLDAYIKPAKNKKRRGGRGGGGNASTAVVSNDGLEETFPQEDVATCPVCKDFQGDATAIAHHVAAHFDD
ncbi:hypothetical protein QBC43DRAFT_46358 [Cladorrhinum sp. PSN259]|nr:hypothetical protein QBC43DRAFT_46358 [Cladorrhinum sp. PSN259]